MAERERARQAAGLWSAACRGLNRPPVGLSPKPLPETRSQPRPRPTASVRAVTEESHERLASVLDAMLQEDIRERPVSVLLL